MAGLSVQSGIESPVALNALVNEPLVRSVI
jgi:hypothetical protein